MDILCYGVANQHYPELKSHDYTQGSEGAYEMWTSPSVISPSYVTTPEMETIPLMLFQGCLEESFHCGNNICLKII